MDIKSQPQSLNSKKKLQRNIDALSKRQLELHSAKERFVKHVESASEENMFLEINNNLFKKLGNKKAYIIERDKYARDMLKTATVCEELNTIALRTYDLKSGKKNMSQKDFGNFVNQIYIHARKSVIHVYTEKYNQEIRELNANITETEKKQIQEKKQRMAIETLRTESKAKKKKQNIARDISKLKKTKKSNIKSPWESSKNVDNSITASGGGGGNL